PVTLTPTASQLLNVWEQGRSQTQVQRAFSLLTLALPDQSASDLAGFTVGRRDRELLGLRERLFGSQFASTAACPACGQELEVDFSVADICTPPTPEAEKFYSLQLEGYELSFRLPTCDDLASLKLGGSTRECKSTLLQR